MSAVDATARIVALHHKVGTAIPRRAVPRARQPKLIESDYAARLVDQVKQWRDAIQPLVDALPEILDAARRYRTDDDSDSRRVRSLVLRGRQTVGRTAQVTRDQAQRAGKLVADHGKREFSRQSKAALGVELVTLDRAVPTRIGHFIAENVADITRLGDRTMGDVESLVARAFTNDMTVDELAKEIENRFGIAERHARFIASDQIKRLDAQVARMRHQEVGIATFRWKTRGDGRVRPAHAVKHDRIFPYEGSRAPSFMPGDDVACRCEAIPVFDEIRMAAGVGKGRKRVA